MSDKQMTYTFLEFLQEFVERVEASDKSAHDLNVTLTDGSVVGLTIVLRDITLAGEASEALH